VKSRAKHYTTRCWPNEVVGDVTKRSIEGKRKVCLKRAMIDSIKSQRGVENESVIVRSENPCG
jgi:hypothetical protein